MHDVEMVAAYCGETFCQTVTHNHIQSDAVNELLDVRRHRGSGCREDIGILQSQLLTDQTEEGLVDQLVL